MTPFRPVIDRYSTNRSFLKYLNVLSAGRTSHRSERKQPLTRCSVSVQTWPFHWDGTVKRLYFDLIEVMNSGRLVLIFLLDLSAAFYTSTMISYVDGCPRLSELQESRCIDSILTSRIECSQCFSRVKNHDRCPTGFGFRATTFYLVHCGHWKSYPDWLSFTLRLRWRQLATC